MSDSAAAGGLSLRGAAEVRRATANKSVVKSKNQLILLLVFLFFLVELNVLRGKDSVSVTADCDPSSVFFCFPRERLLHAPLPAGCTSNREHTSRRSAVHTLWRLGENKNGHRGRKHCFTLSVCGGSDWNESETAKNLPSDPDLATNLFNYRFHQF